MHRKQYHPVAKILHWVIAAMIVLQFILAKFAESAATPMQELALNQDAELAKALQLLDFPVKVANNFLGRTSNQ